MEGLLALAKSLDSSFTGTKEPFFFPVYIQFVISKHLTLLTTPSDSCSFQSRHSGHGYLFPNLVFIFY